jgi:hypothetical protein
MQDIYQLLFLSRVQMLLGNVTSYCGPLETFIMSVWFLCSYEIGMPYVKLMKQSLYL